MYCRLNVARFIVTVNHFRYNGTIIINKNQYFVSIRCFVGYPWALMFLLFEYNTKQFKRKRLVIGRH